jgi:chromosome segregation ATPase
MTAEILLTNTGAKVNLTDAIKTPEDSEKTIRILCDHIDETDANSRKRVGELLDEAARRNVVMKSCEEDVKRLTKKMLDETSLRLRAERKIDELQMKLATNEERNLKQKKRIQDLENINRTIKNDRTTLVEQMKKAVATVVEKTKKASEEEKDAIALELVEEIKEEIRAEVSSEEKVST